MTVFEPSLNSSLPGLSFAGDGLCTPLLALMHVGWLIRQLAPHPARSSRFDSTSTVIQKIEAIFGHFGSLGTTNAPLSLFGEEISCHAMILTAGGMAAPAA